MHFDRSKFRPCPGECRSNQPYDGQKYQSDRSQQQKAGKSDRLVIMLKHIAHLWIAAARPLIQPMHELSIRTCVYVEDQKKIAHQVRRACVLKE